MAGRTRATTMRHQRFGLHRDKQRRAGTTMYVPASPRQRATSALASGLIVAGIGAMLVYGLQVGFRLPAREDFVAIGIAPDRSPEKKPPPPPRATSSAPKGSPSPKNLRNLATPVVAPTTPPLIVPPPIVAAPVPAAGSAANTGASDQRGPGQGAGGIGDGLGGGGDGGDGDGGAAVVGPRQIRGRLSIDDIDEGLLAPGEEVSVGVIYKVNVDGRVSDCKVRRHSGMADIDAMACRLIERRFVFRPARNRNGDAVASWVGETHTWFERMDGR